MNYADDDDPMFELVHDDDNCRNCEHYHDPSVDCPPPGEPCGDYRCCIN